MSNFKVGSTMFGWDCHQDDISYQTQIWDSSDLDWQPPEEGLERLHAVVKNLLNFDPLGPKSGSASTGLGYVLLL